MVSWTARLLLTAYSGDLRFLSIIYSRCPTGDVVAKSRTDLLQGTLELLILKTLSLEPMHGWGISERIQQWSGEVLLVNQGSLYPALQRMKRKGWITSQWRVTQNNRKARYYALTPAGQRQLGEERQAWSRSSEAVKRVLRTAF